jgi:sensor c-di-GMP phosphodiesterase-like protein
MEDIAAHSEKLLALKAMGINVAIDDFGTGYSSLSYLAKLPVDSLKIDRSFISTMMQESQSMTIVAMIISLAHALQLRVVAEGVETVEQARVLRNLGCDEAQGHLFSEALAWHACLTRCNFIETSSTPASLAHGDGRLTGSASRRGMLDAQPVARGQWSGTSAR